jgi:hypothetical protein
MEIYTKRLAAEEDLKEAEYGDDTSAPDELRYCISRLDAVMHDIYHEYEVERNQRGHDSGEETQDTTDVNTSSSAPSSSDHPAVAVINRSFSIFQIDGIITRHHGGQTLRNDAVTNVRNPFNISNHYIQAPKREDEGKFEPGVPEDQEAFRIWVSHCGLEQFQMVWATKPLRAIYQFVQRWLQTDFEITVPLADIDIIYDASEGGETLMRLPITGVVVDVPLMEEDVLYVQVS